MKKELNQKVSNFLDDELLSDDLDHLLREFKQQPEIKETLLRYQLVGQIMRNEGISLREDFLTKVQQEIKQHPHHFLPKQQHKNKSKLPWKKTSLAIAASVIVVSVIGFQMFKFDAKQQSQVILQASTEKQPTNLVNESQHERLKAYLKAHSDDLYVGGAVNFQPYARVARYGKD